MVTEAARINLAPELELSFYSAPGSRSESSIEEAFSCLALVLVGKSGRQFGIDGIAKQDQDDGDRYGGI